MLLLEESARGDLWKQLIEGIEAYVNGIAAHRVTPELDPAKVRAYLAAADFERPCEPGRALEFVLDGLWRFQTHTPHPNYYGLFNPAPATMGIAADALVAAFNPQLADLHEGAVRTYTGANSSLRVVGALVGTFPVAGRGSQREVGYGRQRREGRGPVCVTRS